MFEVRLLYLRYDFGFKTRFMVSVSGNSKLSFMIMDLQYDYDYRYDDYGINVRGSSFFFFLANSRFQFMIMDLQYVFFLFSLFSFYKYLFFSSL